MRLRLLPIVAAALLASVGAAGCGQSEKDKYIEAYKPVNDELIKLGQRLGTAVNSASSENNAQLARKFTALDADFKKTQKRIDDLDTPDDLKDESKALSDAIGTVEGDVAEIAKAAKESDPRAAAAATVRLTRDSNRVNVTQNKLAKATGAEVGGR
jgi:hypothetical protein